MVKLIKKYSRGDKVFAKVRGYPPWPARIESVTDPNSKAAKYKVFFYGTSETATCKVDEIFEYHENKERFGKPIKRKNFHQGIEQLEQELNNDLRKSSVSENKESVVQESETENHPAVTETSGANLDSDLETGPLVIDEGDKKKPLKRKSLATAPLNSMDTPESKKKKGRGKSLTASIPEANDSPGEDIIGKEVVSRSGRKIKPKRFADFSAEDEYDLDTVTRGRAKSKNDESNENISTPSSAPGKKRTSIEKDEKKNMKISTEHQKITLFRIESQLLTLDAEIKLYLALHHADVDKCLQAMDEMLGLPLTCLMLKKHSQVVDTIKRLRRYIGNLPEWDLSSEDEAYFKKKAEQIRQKADDIYTKFKGLFNVPEGQSFWKHFTNHMDIFKDITKDMTEEKLFGLISDPSSSESTPPGITMSGDEVSETSAVDPDVSSEASIGSSPVFSAK